MDWIVSEHSRAIVKYYAEYTEYTESEVVDMFLKNLLKDEKFLEWVDSKRNNRRMVKAMELVEGLGE